MDIFLTLVLNLLPLYFLIALGYIAGRFLKVDRISLANLALYFCVPVVMFGYILKLEYNPAYSLLPILMYVVSALIAFTMLYIGRRIYGDSRANVLTMLSAQANAGYLGLPVMLLVFNAQWVAVYMLLLLGGVIFEATIGYYIAARGAFDPKKSFIKLLSFPAIYALPLALLLRQADVNLPDTFWTYWEHFKGAYVILGMMIIGAALSTLEKFVFSWRFNGLVFLGKFIMWPLLMGAFIFADIYYFNLFGHEVYKMLMLLSVMPSAANVAAFAAQFNINPEKAATTILVSTVLVLLLIPLMVWAFG